MAEYLPRHGVRRRPVPTDLSRWAEALREVSIAHPAALPARRVTPPISPRAGRVLRARGSGRALAGPRRLGDAPQRRLPARRRPHRAGQRPHAPVRTLPLVTRCRSRLRASLPGGGLASTQPSRRHRRIVGGRRRAGPLWGALRRAETLRLLRGGASHLEPSPSSSARLPFQTEMPIVLALDRLGCSARPCWPSSRV